MTTIREATESDIPAVLALTALWASEPSTTGHYTYNREEDLQRRLADCFLVAEARGTIVGFLLGEVSGRSAGQMMYQVVEQGETCAELSQLYVHPEHRNRGIGSALVSRFREWAAAQGLERCVLLSQSVNWERTQRFYARHGFRPWYFTLFTGLSTEERRQNPPEP